MLLIYLHIELYFNSVFAFYDHIYISKPFSSLSRIIESCRFASMVGLIEHAQQLSHDQILCYVKPSSQLQQPFPVRLTSPISKFDEVPSLQHICRFVVRRHIDDASLTYLPPRLRDYVRQKPFLGREIGYFEA